MTGCLVHPGEDHDPDHEEGWTVCRRGHDRMAGALRAIPDLVDELSGLGYVERDVRTLKCTMLICDTPARWRGSFEPKEGPPDPRLALCASHALILFTDGLLFGVRPVLPAADPIAHTLTAGPLNGSKGSPRVSGSSEARVPIRIDPTDLTAPARPGSLAVAYRGAYVYDQIGHLSVATELEFWARAWADERGERSPYPTVRLLAPWLLDRLGWACGHFMALDEFAEKLRTMRNALTAAAGRFDAPPETLSAPCPECRMLTLYRDVDMERVACAAGCLWLMTDEEYAAYAKRLIEEMP